MDRIMSFDPYIEFSKEHLQQVHFDLNANYEERMAYEQERYEHKILLRNLKDRFTVHYGQPKKYYATLLKYTKIQITIFKEMVRKNRDNDLAQEYFKKYLDMENKIKFIIKTFSKEVKTLYNIQAAKQYPMQNLLSFNAANFTKCIYHDEKTPSMYLNPQKNNVHCFSCGKNADTIDVTQQIFSKSFGEAVRFLCPSG